MLVACGSGEVVSGEVICPGAARGAIVVSVSDSITGSRAPFTNVKLVAVDGAYSESSRADSITATMVATGRDTIMTAVGRRGFYTVRVTADGYRPWLASNVISLSQCAYDWRFLSVRLQR